MSAGTEHPWLRDGVPVEKSEGRSVGVVWFANADAVRALDLSGSNFIAIDRFTYRKDTAETTAEDDGIQDEVVRDSAGNGWFKVRGDTYDLVVGSTGMIGDGEEFPAVIIPTPMTLRAGLILSRVMCDVAPLGSYTVTWKMKRGAGAWTSIFTATFSAGQTSATLTLAADVELIPGDRVRAVGAATHDANFQGLTATIVAER